MITSETQNYGAFTSRIALGTILLAHALLKIFVFTIPGTVGFFESLGLPGIFAYLTIIGELAGGIALIFGFYSRLAAVLSIPILMGAAWAHIGNGWVFSNTGGGWEFPVLLIILAVTVAIQGNGAFAIRRLPIIDKLIPDVFKV